MKWFVPCAKDSPLPVPRSLATPMSPIFTLSLPFSVVRKTAGGKSPSKETARESQFSCSAPTAMMRCKKRRSLHAAAHRSLSSCLGGEPVVGGDSAAPVGSERGGSMSSTRKCQLPHALEHASSCRLDHPSHKIPSQYGVSLRR